MTVARTLAFVSDAIYPYNKGGKETRLYEITTRLAKRGYDVHIYCMKWWQGPEKERDENGVHLHGICPYIPLYDGPRRSIKQGVLFGLACFKLLGAKFDVVDVDHMPFFPLYSVRVVCWLRGKKMQATWHEVWGLAYWREYLGPIKGTVAGVIEQMSVALPSTIMSVSQMTAQRLIKQFGYKGKLLVVPNGIDLETIQAAPVSTTKSDVIFAGRLLGHKNIDVFLEALALVKQQNPQVKAIIAGEGPEKKNLKLLANRLGLEKNVTFLPFQEHIKDLYSLIKASKVFVLPSSREGFGLVVLEANACGIPVITVDEKDNAAKSLINGKNGTVCQLNVKSLAAAIEKDIHPYAGTKQTLISGYSWDEPVERIKSFLNNSK